MSSVENNIKCSCEYNFDITANWNLTLDGSGDPYPIINESTFKNWLETGQDGLNNQNSFTNVVIFGFKKSGDRIRCNISASATDIIWQGLEISNFNKIGDIQGLVSLDLGQNALTNFNPSIALPNGLEVLNLGGNIITNFNPSIALPNTILTLGLSGCGITNFNPSIALPSSLKYLELSSNQITVFNPSIALPNGLERLELGQNYMVYFNPSIALPTTMKRIIFTQNQMTTLGYQDSEDWANGLHTAPPLGLIGFTSNIDSVSGTDLDTILSSKGWAVQL